MRFENGNLSSNYWIAAKRLRINLLPVHCGILEALGFKYLNDGVRVESPLKNSKFCNFSKLCQDVGCLAQHLLGLKGESMCPSEEREVVFPG